MGEFDKQIIIDGVDVSGCVRLQDDNISCELGGKCQGWDNCYYKQLRRKEQECAEWKHQAELGCETTNRLTKELEEKEKEIEDMRETMHKDICFHYVLGECSQKHHNNCVGRNQCIKDLEQRLEKIKQYVEDNEWCILDGTYKELLQIIEE